MIIFPDIEIQDGHCVNRIRGKEQEPEKYDISPMDAAKQFVAAGAERLHVIDVESSLKSGGFNHDLICDIIDSVDVPVQVGGGIQTQSGVDWWFDHGAARVVLGTVAVKDRLLTMEVCNRHPGKIIISITGKDGHAMIDSWQTKTSFTPLELAKSFEESGAGAIIYADLDRFEGGQEVGLASTIEIGTELNIPLISTGTVYSLDDVSTLALLPNIEGVIIGRALFNGTVDLAEAIETAKAARVAPELADEGVAPKHHGISGIPVTTINRVGINSSDTDRSAKFYEVLGFSMEPDAESSDDSVPMRHFRGAGISLLPALHGAISPVRLALEVDSMAQTKACLEYNNIAITDVVEDESRTTIMIQDPDGNQIEFDRYW
jgi:phosphoribosylformimino-5-aminoimidazole carboxamide ribotide isomerase